MTQWIRKIALVLILALLVIQPRTEIAAMEDYPRTSSAMCAIIEQDSFINPEDLGCPKRSSESRRADQCIPVFDEQRQARGQACPFLKSFGKPSPGRIFG